jgi:hypothetical protein
VSLDIPLPFAQCTYVIVYGRHYRSIDLNVSSAWVIFSATHVVRDETWFYLISSFPSLFFLNMKILQFELFFFLYGIFMIIQRRGLEVSLRSNPFS